MIPALPLEYAAVLGDIEEVQRLLVQGVDVDATAADGYTALHGAAENNRLEVLKLLLEWGANPNPRLPSGHPPLDLAEGVGASDVASFLRLVGGINGAPPGTPLTPPPDIPD